MNNAQELRAETQAKLKSDALNRVLASNNENLLECRKWKRRYYILVGVVIFCGGIVVVETLLKIG